MPDPAAAGSGYYPVVPPGRKPLPSPVHIFETASFRLNLSAFASFADVAKGGDGAKSALREIFLRLRSCPSDRF
jgi:hypothetical protein